MVVNSNYSDVVNNMEDNIINLLSDLEEGELEELSDVSSEEELLLRQRIAILENYNSVLEKKHKREKSVCKDSTKLCSRKEDKIHKVRHFHKRKRNTSIKGHNISKRHRRKKALSSGSENEEYSKKKFLREAIGISEKKVNKTSLKNRLFPFIKDVKKNDSNNTSNEANVLGDFKENVSEADKNLLENLEDVHPLELKIIENNISDNNTQLGDDNKETVVRRHEENCVSEDDADILRQLALNSKASKKVVKSDIIKEDNKLNDVKEQNNSDGSDGDEAELRIIALRSAMLKKAMERKRQRRESKRKRNSKRFRKISDILSDLEDFSPCEDDNIRNEHTDIEEVDMDLDPESLQNSTNNIYYDQASDPTQVMRYLDQQSNNVQYDNSNQIYQYIYNDLQYYDSNNYILQPVKLTDRCNINQYQECYQQELQDLEEDEDILRAKLLNSMSSINSKNIEVSLPSTSKIVPVIPVPCDDSNLIIRLGESDSESECEETKQLIKTNQEILKETLFQRNLDLFLKTARSKVECSVPSTPKNCIASSTIVKKHTPVAVKHLPAADQHEYRELVKRMSELEKMKMAKQQQAMINSIIDTSNCNHSEKVLVNNKSSLSVIPSKGVVPNNLDDIEKKKKLTKAIALHLESTRKKILNHSKMSKRLEIESKSLKVKYEGLKIQAQEIEIALRGTRNKLSENQRLSNTTNRTLTKLQKHGEILQNKIKHLTSGLNKSVKSNISQTDSTYATKIMMKNKVINKKLNIHKSNVITQMKTGVNIVKNKIEKFVRLPTKIIVNENVIGNGKEQTDSLAETITNENTIDLHKNRQCDKSLQHSTVMKINENEGESKVWHADSTECSVNVIEMNKTKQRVLGDEKSDVVKDIVDNKVGVNVNTIGVSKPTSQSNGLLIENIKIAQSAELLDSIDNVDGKNRAMFETKELPDVNENNFKDVSDVDKTVTPVINHSIICIRNPLDLVKLSDSDYESPLHVLKAGNVWTEDVQGIFCPFEVGGSCKDPECKYFHPKSS